MQTRQWPMKVRITSNENNATTQKNTARLKTYTKISDLKNFKMNFFVRSKIFGRSIIL